MKHYKLLVSTLIVCIVLQFISLDCRAQTDNIYLETKPGKWSYKYLVNVYEASFKLTSADRSALQNKLKTIADVLHKNAVVAEPKGIDLQVTGSCYESYVLGEGKHATDRVPGKVTISFCDWMQRGEKEFLMTMEVPVAIFTTNTPEHTYKDVNENFTSDGYDEKIITAAKKVNEVFSEPKEIKDLGNNVKLYENNVIIAAKDNRPYWIPITVRAYFERVFAYYDAYAKRCTGLKNGGRDFAKRICSPAVTS